MRFIMNALDEDQTTIVHGKHFSFKGKQIKPFQNEEIANTILRERKEMGFVEIPKVAGDDETSVEDYDRSPAGLAIIEDARRHGIEEYCNKLRKQVYNLQVSLKKDLAIKNMNIDPAHLASDGDLKSMEALVKYQSRKEDASHIRAEKAKKLLEKI